MKVDGDDVDDDVVVDDEYDDEYDEDGCFYSKAFTQRLLYTDSFTHRCLYTRKLLDTGALTHVKLLYTDVFTCRSLYTSYRQMLLHRCFYAYVPLHTKRLYIENTVTQRRALHTQKLLHADAAQKSDTTEKSQFYISF